jgi:hypothetical protein
MAHLFRSAVMGIAGADEPDQPTSAHDGKSNGLLLSLGIGWIPEKPLARARGRGSMRRKFARVKHEAFRRMKTCLAGNFVGRVRATSANGLYVFFIRQ